MILHFIIMKRPTLCLLVALAAACSLHGSNASRSYHASSRALQQQSCDAKLAPSLEVLKPHITPAPIIDLQWLDKDDKNVIAITRKISRIDAGGLWVSNDGGNTWAEKTAALNGTGLPGGEQVEVVGIFAQKSAPANVVLLGAGTTYWTSKDYGNTYTQHQTEGAWKGMSIRSYKLHPWQENWMLLLVKRPGCTVRTTSECPQDLMLTQDLFSSSPKWRNLTQEAKGSIAGFVDFDWAANLCPAGPNTCDTGLQVRTEGILATMYEKPDDYDLAWDPDVHFVASDSWFSQWTTHVRCGNMFEIIGKSVYLAFANSCPTDISGNKRKDTSPYPSAITLYTSLDGGSSFHQACLPVAIKQEGYELLETHDGTGAIVIVDYEQNNIQASSVYTAGPHHALFSLTLKDVNYYRSRQLNIRSASDFARIEGLPGLYMGNRMLSRPPGSQPSETPDYYYNDYDLSDVTDKPVIETRITFNGGGRWQSIKAPLSFRNQSCNGCGDKPNDCMLHLHGMANWGAVGPERPAVYSNPSAPGLIIGTGNTAPRGLGLDDNQATCTWLSTDGGVTWSDVGVGTYIYEFADYGGVVVMAKHWGGTNQAASEVMFSWDGGQCWQHVQLEEALLVDNIRIEPDGQRPRVILHGRRCTKTAQNPTCHYTVDQSLPTGVEGIMYVVDVEALEGSRLPRCTAADRELWGVPEDVPGAQPRCVLGRRTSYERRKWASNCLNGGDYVRPAPQTTPCDCTVELDAECDYGWNRNGVGKCEKLDPASLPVCPVVRDGLYTVSSSGKRLVHADTCLGASAMFPDTDGKGTQTNESGRQGGGGSKKKTHSAWFGFIMFLLVMFALGGLFTGWWIYLATESARDVVRDLAAGAAATVVSIKHWLMDKIRGRSSANNSEDLAYFQPLGDMGSSDDDPNRSLFTLK